MRVSVSRFPATREAKTRAAVLEAAGEVFAESGFRAATVREICRRAGANVAAINYHFRDKEGLYGEVLRYSFRRSFEKYPPDFGLAPGAAPEARLRGFVRAYLLRIFDVGHYAWRGKLISREMIEPTRALDRVVNEEIRPLSLQLGQIVRDLLPGKVTDEKVRLCCFSIVSQCVFYHHCKPVVSRLFPEQKFNPKQIDRLADHISSFSLAGLKHLARTKGK